MSLDQHGDQEVYQGPERRRNEVLVLESDRFWLKVMSAVVVAGILGAAGLMMDMRSDIAVIQSQLDGMQGQANATGKYTAEMAAKDRELVNQQLQMITVSLSGLREEQKSIRDDMRTLRADIRGDASEARRAHPVPQ
jgi:predicted nuclease with TOPRIM domain